MERFIIRKPKQQGIEEHPEPDPSGPNNDSGITIQIRSAAAHSIQEEDAIIEPRIVPTIEKLIIRKRKQQEAEVQPEPGPSGIRSADAQSQPIVESGEVDLEEIQSESELTIEPKPKKKKIYGHKFQEKWITTYPWLRKEKDKIFCTVCIRHLKCSLFDIKRHADTDCHKRNVTKSKNTPKITSVLKDENVLKKHQLVKQAELKLCVFLHEHNLPFLLADHLPSFIRSVCPDSEIAKNINCSRTKATYITNECISIEQLNIISDVLKTNKFSLVIDETTDISTEKSLVLVARYFNENTKKVCDSFFGLIKITNSSAEFIFLAIQEYLNRYKIPLQNLIGLAADNAAVMKGNKTGVQARFREILPNMFFLGCTCHSIHLCASSAANKLPNSVEDFIRDLYNYFSNSSKRIDHFGECQVFCQLKPHKLLHPAQTRWLSLQAAVDRVLENWQPLILFFTNESFNQNLHVCNNLLESLKNPIYKLYFCFLSYILDIVNTMNLEFQSQKIKIHLLLSRISDLYRNVLKNYIKLDYISKNKDNLKIIDPKNPHNFLPIQEIHLGTKFEVLLDQNHNLKTSDIEAIKLKCVDFYIELAKQIKDRFDFDNPILSFISCFDPKTALSGKVSSIVINCKKNFPNLVLDEEKLNAEWRMIPDMTELQNIAETNNFDMELFWGYVFDLKNALEEPMFPNLSYFVKGILALPHSSATAERIFSQLFLLKTKVRNRLNIDTCSNILHVKELVKNETCYTWKPTPSLLRRNFRESAKK